MDASSMNFLALDGVREFVFRHDRFIVDLENGKFEGCERTHWLKKKDLPLRLLRVLAANEGEVVRQEDLFETLFPGEPDQGKGNPLRLRQVCGRLRAWAERHKIPLQIECVDRGVRLVAGRELQFHNRRPE
jgi:hypothetical protein